MKSQNFIGEMVVRHVLHLRPENGVREPVAYGNGDDYYQSKHVPVCETESVLSTKGSWESEDEGDDTDAGMTAGGVDTSEFGEGPNWEDYDDVEDFLPRLYIAILRETHVEHPRPRPAKPMPLPEEPQRVFTDRRVLKLADAIKREDLDAIDSLLKEGVNVNARGKLGCTPLV